MYDDVSNDGHYRRLLLSWQSSYTIALSLRSLIMTLIGSAIPP